MRVFLIVIGVVVAFGLIAGGYYLGQRQITLAPVAPTAPTTPVATPAVAPKPPSVIVPPPLPADPNIKVFTSTDLLISFNYLEVQSGGKFSAKQVGSKVYVYNIKYPFTQGQYVEVFSKDKNDDLKAAIAKKFLSNYSSSDCFSEIVANPVAKQPTPASFVLAEISVPKSSSDGMEQLSVKWDKCPSPYTTTNGIAYFATDTTHPDKFVFFSIGQYGINGGPNNLLWQSTLTFL